MNVRKNRIELEHIILTTHEHSQLLACPWCAYEMDSSTTRGDDPGTALGDIWRCGHCLLPSRLEFDDGKPFLRQMTPEEMESEIRKHPKVGLRMQQTDQALKCFKCADFGTDLCEECSSGSPFANHQITGFISCDSTGHAIAVNDFFCQIVGRTTEEVMTLPSCEVLTHPDDMSRCREAIHQMIGERKNTEIEKRYLRPNGQSVSVLALYTPLTTQNGIAGAAVVLPLDPAEVF